MGTQIHVCASWSQAGITSLSGGGGSRHFDAKHRDVLTLATKKRNRKPDNLWRRHKPQQQWYERCWGRRNRPIFKVFFRRYAKTFNQKTGCSQSQRVSKDQVRELVNYVIWNQVDSSPPSYIHNQPSEGKHNADKNWVWHLCSKLYLHIQRSENTVSYT